MASTPLNSERKGIDKLKDLSIFLKPGFFIDLYNGNIWKSVRLIEYNQEEGFLRGTTNYLAHRQEAPIVVVNYLFLTEVFQKD